MSEDTTILPTQGVSMEKQRLILRAYALLSKKGLEPVHYLDVVKRGRLGRTQVCGVNLFFVGLGLLKQVDQGIYLPSEETMQFLGEDFDGHNYKEISSLLRTSALYDFVQGQVAIHEGITYDDLIEDLLRESNTSEVYRAKRALDWLFLAKLIERNDENGIVTIFQI